MSDHRHAFAEEMSNRGMPLTKGLPEDDRKIHRFAVPPKKDDDWWYVLHPQDPVSGGAFGCWATGEKYTWVYRNGTNHSPKDMADFKRRMVESERQREKEERERWERSAKRAEDEISKLKPAESSHEYLASKKIQNSCGLLVNERSELVIPLKDIHGKLWTYQTIDLFGDKLFLFGGKIRGCFYQIGEFDDGPIVVCEGVATGLTINQSTGWPVLCAMNCGNLKQVCQDVRTKHPKKMIVVAADNDRFTESNPGLTKAKEAASAAKASLVFPEFPEGSDSGTDFNDLAAQTTTANVRLQFNAVIGAGLGQRIGINALMKFVPEDDKTSVLGQRYLCQGGSCVIVGQTSVGKSSLSLQMAIMFAIGLPFFGLKPRRPLKSVYVQAENDEGDLAEMIQGILAGLGLITGDLENDRALLAVLEKNLIIIRDQVHVGQQFPVYARKLIDIHQPDLFWMDPMLSFYGDDINDQKAMSSFLRSGLNPISEETGVVWMLLHHTGKPSKDAAKTQKSWSSRDFAYMGLGSSELSNWARAIITVVNSGEDEFRVVFAKRGWRAGIEDDKGNPTTELNLAHAGEYICWKRIPKPKDDDDMNPEFVAAARLITSPTSATQIVRVMANKLQRGERTVWKFWDGGEGPLGLLFEKQADGKTWLPKSGKNTPSYDAD